jgi:D-galactarolactone isomerase
MAIPSGACDTHVHIFEAEAIAGADAKLELASLQDYRQQTLGFDRTIFVQPSAFKFDNAGVLTALRNYGDAARAVVTIPPDVPDATLEDMSARGVRGVRFHLLKTALQSWDDILPTARRVAPLGWHVQLQFDGRQFPEHFNLLSDLPGSLVIDQTGKFLEPVELDHPAFTALLRLLDKGKTYVKLSAPYEVSKSGPPDYADVGILARALIRHAPERMLWASNWPHHVLAPENRVTNATMFDVFRHWAPDPATQQLILVDNPAKLYGFAQREL